jgi:hypothetical protein
MFGVDLTECLVAAERSRPIFEVREASPGTTVV